MARLMRDLLAQRASERFVGREDELAILFQMLEEDGPPIVFLHGLTGIGKSSLLSVFAARAREQGAHVIHLDCRAIEPTERGFLHELGMATGADLQTVAEAADYLAQLDGPVVLILDTYELLRLLDTWLRQTFVPGLSEPVRLLFAGREAPVTAWLASPGWQGLLRTVNLGPLHSAEALELLAGAGVERTSANRIEQLARGHPLALTLATGTMAGSTGADLDGVAVQRIIDGLIETYMADVPDPTTRRALEAASVVRRVTISVLAAMVPDVHPQEVLDQLRSLPFVENGRDGLIVHDAVRLAIAARLRSLDPVSYRDLRLSAWHQLRREVRTAPKAEMWRYTADMLYIIENPVIHEAFFPTDAHLYAVEPARYDDKTAILAMSAQHDGSTMTDVVERWWNAVPGSFNTVRNRDGMPVGYYQMCLACDLPPDLLRDDPVVARWVKHLRTHPVPKGQQVLFYRRWMDKQHGEATSPVQAACWLDAKRAYMELRPDLRRVYTHLRDLPAFAPVAQRLGFQPMSDGAVEVDGQTYYSAVLDFGPSSVDGWLARLVGVELGMQDTSLLNSESRELAVDGRNVGLTPLEFAVMQYLVERQDKAVPRGDLLEDVWGAGYVGGSNVVDVVIRSLRSKLGTQSGQLETVRGVGYRLRGT